MAQMRAQEQSLYDRLSRQPNWRGILPTAYAVNETRPLQIETGDGINREYFSVTLAHGCIKLATALNHGSWARTDYKAVTQGEKDLIMHLMGPARKRQKDLATIQCIGSLTPSIVEECERQGLRARNMAHSHRWREGKIGPFNATRTQEPFCTTSWYRLSALGDLSAQGTQDPWQIYPNLDQINGLYQEGAITQDLDECYRHSEQRRDRSVPEPQQKVSIPAAQAFAARCLSGRQTSNVIATLTVHWEKEQPKTDLGDKSPHPLGYNASVEVALIVEFKIVSHEDKERALWIGKTKEEHIEFTRRREFDWTFLPNDEQWATGGPLLFNQLLNFLTCKYCNRPPPMNNVAWLYAILVRGHKVVSADAAPNGQTLDEYLRVDGKVINRVIAILREHCWYGCAECDDVVKANWQETCRTSELGTQPQHRRTRSQTTPGVITQVGGPGSQWESTAHVHMRAWVPSPGKVERKYTKESPQAKLECCYGKRCNCSAAYRYKHGLGKPVSGTQWQQCFGLGEETKERAHPCNGWCAVSLQRTVAAVLWQCKYRPYFLKKFPSAVSWMQGAHANSGITNVDEIIEHRINRDIEYVNSGVPRTSQQTTGILTQSWDVEDPQRWESGEDDSVKLTRRVNRTYRLKTLRLLQWQTTMGQNVEEGHVTADARYNMNTNQYPEEEWTAADVFMGLNNMDDYNRAIKELSDITQDEAQLITHANLNSCLVTALGFAPMIDNIAKLLIHDEAFKNDILDAKLSTMTHRSDGLPIKSDKTIRRIAIADEFRRILLSQGKEDQRCVIVSCIEAWTQLHSISISTTSVIRPLCYQMANMWMYEYEEEKRLKKETQRQQEQMEAETRQSQPGPATMEPAEHLWQNLMGNEVRTSDASLAMDVEPEEISPTIPFDPTTANAPNHADTDEVFETGMDVDQEGIDQVVAEELRPHTDNATLVDSRQIGDGSTATRATPPAPVASVVHADAHTSTHAVDTATRATPPAPVASANDDDVHMSAADHSEEISPETMREILQKAENLMKTRRNQPSTLLKEISELIEPTIADFAADDDGLKCWSINPSAHWEHCDYFHATSRACFRHGYAIGACQEVGVEQQKKFDLWITLTDENGANRMTILGHPAYVKRIIPIGNYTYRDMKTTVNGKTGWLTYFQVADVELHEGTKIRVVNVHLHHVTAKRFSQNIQQMTEALKGALRQLLTYVSPRTMTIMVGDFNQTGARGLLTTYLNDIVREISQSSTVVQEINHAELRILDTISRYNPDENDIDSDTEHMRGEPCDCVITNIGLPDNLEISEWKVRNGRNSKGEVFNKAEPNAVYKQVVDKRGIAVRKANDGCKTVSKLVPRHNHTKGNTPSGYKPEHHTNLINLGGVVKPISVDYTTQIAQKMFYEEVGAWPQGAESKKRQVEVQLVRAEVDRRLQQFENWEPNQSEPDPRYAPLPERRTLRVGHDRPEVQIDKRDFEIHCRCYIVFRTGGEYTFPSCLDGEDRQEVHNIANLYKLSHESYGEDPQRVTVVSTAMLTKATKGQRAWTRDEVENQGVWKREPVPPAPTTATNNDNDITQLSEELSTLQTSVENTIRTVTTASMAVPDETRATPPISQASPASSSTVPYSVDITMTDTAAATVARAQAQDVRPPAHRPRPAPPAPTVPQKKDKDTATPNSAKLAEEHTVEEFIPAEHTLNSTDAAVRARLLELLKAEKYVCDEVDKLQLQIQRGEQLDEKLLDELFRTPTTTIRQASAAELEWQKRMQTDSKYQMWDFINDHDAKEELDKMTTSERDNWYRVGRDIICQIQPNSSQERWELLTRRNFEALMRGDTTLIWLAAPLPANLEPNSKSKAYIRGKLKQATAEDKKILLLRYCKALKTMQWSAGLGRNDQKERRQRMWIWAKCHAITRDYFLQLRPKPKMRVGDINAALAGVTINTTTTNDDDNVDTMIKIEQLTIRRASESPKHIPWHEEAPNIIPVPEAIAKGIIAVPTTWEPQYWLQNLRDSRNIGYGWFNLAEHYSKQLHKSKARNSHMQVFIVVDTITTNEGLRWIFEDSSITRRWKSQNAITEETRLQWANFEDRTTLTFGLDLFPKLWEGYGDLNKNLLMRDHDIEYNGRWKRGNPAKWLQNAVKRTSKLRHDHAQLFCTKATSDWIPWSDMLAMLQHKVHQSARDDFPELRDMLHGRNGDQWVKSYVTEPEILGAILINNNTEQGQKQRFNFAMFCTLHGRFNLPKSEATVEDGELIFPNNDGHHHPTNPVRCNCTIPNAHQWYREPGYTRDLAEAEHQDRLTFSTTHFRHDDIEALICNNPEDRKPDALSLQEIMKVDSIAYAQTTHGESEDKNSKHHPMGSVNSQFQAIRAKTPVLTPKAVRKVTTGFCTHITTWAALPGILASGMKTNVKGRFGWQASLHHPNDDRSKMLRNQRAKDSEEYCILIILCLQYMTVCNVGCLFITTNGLITVTEDTDPDAIREIWYYPGGVHRGDPTKATLLYNKALQKATLKGTEQRPNDEKFPSVVHQIKIHRGSQRNEPDWKRSQMMNNGTPFMYDTTVEEADKLFKWGHTPPTGSQREPKLFRCDTCKRPNRHNALLCWFCADTVLYGIPDNDGISFCPYEYQIRSAEKRITPEEYSEEVQRMVTANTVSAAAATYTTITQSEGMSVTCQAAKLDDDDIVGLTTDHRYIEEFFRQIWNNFRMYYFRNAEGLVNDPKYFGMPEHVVQQAIACGKWPGSISTGECTNTQAWLDAFEEARNNPAFRPEELPWHTIVTAGQLRIDMADASTVAKHTDDDEIEIQSSTAVYIGNKEDQEYGTPHNPFLQNLWQRFTQLCKMIPTIIDKNGHEKAEDLQRTAAHLSPTPISDVHLCLAQTLFKVWITELSYYPDPANSQELLDKMQGKQGYYKWLWNQGDGTTEQRRQWVERILTATMEKLKSMKEAKGLSMPYKDDRQLMKYVRFIIVRTSSKQNNEKQAAMMGSQIEVNDPSTPLNRIKERINKIRAAVAFNPFLFTASNMTVAVTAADIGATPGNVTAANSDKDKDVTQWIIGLGLLVILLAVIISVIAKARHKPTQWCLVITEGNDQTPGTTSSNHDERTRRRRRVRRAPLERVVESSNYCDPAPSNRTTTPYIVHGQPWHTWLDHDELLGLGYCAACWSYRPEIQLNHVAHPYLYRVCDMCMPNLIQGTMNTMSDIEFNRQDIQRMGELSYFKKAIVRGRQITSYRLMFHAWKEVLFPRKSAQEIFLNWDELCNWDDRQLAMPARLSEKQVRYYLYAINNARDEFEQADIENHVIEDFGSMPRFSRQINKLAEEKFEDGIPPPPYEPNQRFRMGRYRYRMPMLNVHDITEHGQTLLERWRVMVGQAQQAQILHKRSTTRYSETVGNAHIITCQRCGSQEDVKNAWKSSCRNCALSKIGQAYNDIFTDIMRLLIERTHLLQSDDALEMDEDCHIWQPEHQWKEQGLANLALQQVLTQAQCQRDELTEEVRQIQIMKKLMGHDWRKKAEKKLPPAAQTKWRTACERQAELQKEQHLLGISGATPTTPGQSSSSNVVLRRRAPSPSPATSSDATLPIRNEMRDRSRSRDDDHSSIPPQAKATVTLRSRAERWERAAASNDTERDRQPQRGVYHEQRHGTTCDSATEQGSNGATPILSLTQCMDREEEPQKKKKMQCEQVHGMHAPAEEDDISPPTWFDIYENHDKRYEEMDIDDIGVTSSADEFTWLYEPSDDWLQKWGSEYLYLPADVQRRRREAMARQDRRSEKRLGNMSVSAEYYDIFWHKDPPRCHKQILCGKKTYRDEDMPTPKPWMLRPARICGELLSLAWVTKDGVDYHVNSVTDPDLRGELALPPTKCDKAPVPIRHCRVHPPSHSTTTTEEKTVAERWLDEEDNVVVTAMPSSTMNQIVDRLSKKTTAKKKSQPKRKSLSKKGDQCDVATQTETIDVSSGATPAKTPTVDVSTNTTITHGTTVTNNDEGTNSDNGSDDSCDYDPKPRKCEYCGHPIQRWMGGPICYSCECGN